MPRTDDTTPKRSLALHRSLFAELPQFDKPLQRAIVAAVERFEQHSHAGLHLEKIASARDPRIRTIRITEFWRGVVLTPESGGSHLLLWVLPHDEAISRAKRYRASVNSVDGSLEIRDEAILDQFTPGFQAQAERSERRLFAHVGDADFRRLGIDDDILATARLLTDLDQLDRVRRSMPASQMDVLENIALGMTVEQAWKALTDGEALNVDPADLATALSRSSGEVAFFDDAEELREVLERPFAAWRIFLHPAQHRVAYRASYSGPAKVTGGAGTGKTVVALHRANHLASRPGVGPDEILLTTYTRNLAAALSANADILIPQQHRTKVRVVNFDKLANEIVSAANGKPPVVLNREAAIGRWRDAALRAEPGVAQEFLHEEYEEVVLAQGIETWERYAAAQRHGRGTALGAQQRKPIWDVIQKYRSDLRRDPRRTFLEVIHEAAQILQQREVKLFRHVIVDEAQDLHPVVWRMLRAAVAPGADDLFIAGDAHQRIYGNKVSLGSLGIVTAGRSAKLRICYRTTSEILGYSLRMLGHDDVDDLEGGSDDNLGVRSVRHGVRPTLWKSASSEEETAKLAEQIRDWEKAGTPLPSIAVAARTNSIVVETLIALAQAGIKVTRLDSQNTEGDGVRIGTMHALKGLEFSHVVLASVNADVLPAPWLFKQTDRDPAAAARDLHAERCLLYVASSRARDKLVVSWHGRPSPLLD
ncbi:hypothetical protein ABH935_004127 [Catenulispora sp. GAS73]|uniref:UvrD-helicase domain-containing protein n=1 Tax=Catenulispora sp. GAS73 TaxID=3156269 RepID=UPI0035145448